MTRRTLIAITLVGAAVGIGLGYRLLHRSPAGGRARGQEPGAEEPGAEKPGGYRHLSEVIMATPVEVLLPAERAEAAAEVFRLFRQVDARMSEWKDSSPLSAVNRAAGRAAVEVPADLRRVIRRGLQLGEQTEGAFDITWAALWGLWDFKAKSPRVPPAEAIDQRRALVDFRQVTVDDAAGTVRLGRVGMKIGLGAIAKGYALDQAAAALRARGVQSFMISAGGQVMAGGLRDGRPWRVGIRDPRGPIDDYFARVELRDASISTSGDYESFFVSDGVRYHHILDPRTGRPSRGLRSATVVSADATLADALSTAAMVLGKKKALALAARRGEVELVLVDDQGQVVRSAGLRKRFHLVHPPRAR